MGEDKKFYLTKEGLERVQKDYENLKGLRVAKTRGEEAPKILESEDLNPEYLTFQEDLSFLESKISELEYIIKNAEIIKPSKKEKGFVGLGARVAVQVDGHADEFTIVGSLEANPMLGKISNESPVGKALLGHKAGDEVCVSSPVSTIYKIKKIKYL